MNGTGYLLGLTALDIPIQAQIITKPGWESESPLASAVG
ncbi:hypothetical protein LJE15_09620 [Planktothrix agardhii 1813]|nr:hypothetical protein [Planktothrix agardhii 1813]